MKKDIIIVSAPSGAGKSSFVDRITEENPELVDVITYTTRPMRAGEIEGKPYHFINREEFERRVKQNFFVEWAKVHTNLYGTSFESIEKAWKHGRTVIMDIDVQGADTFKTKFPHCHRIFILPPSIEELRRRVIKRDGGEPKDLEIRMENAQKEIARAKDFDYQIVNDVYETSFTQFKKIIEKLLT